jgi:hypothetical protein
VPAVVLEVGEDLADRDPQAPQARRRSRPERSEAVGHHPLGDDDARALVEAARPDVFDGASE